MHKYVESDANTHSLLVLTDLQAVLLHSEKKNEQNEFDDPGCLASNELLALPSTPSVWFTLPL